MVGSDVSGIAGATNEKPLGRSGVGGGASRWVGGLGSRREKARRRLSPIDFVLLTVAAEVGGARETGEEGRELVGELLADLRVWRRDCWAAEERFVMERAGRRKLGAGASCGFQSVSEYSIWVIAGAGEVGELEREVVVRGWV